MPLNAARDTVRKEGAFGAYPLKAGAKPYQGGMACTDATGHLVAAADTAGLKFAGMSRYTYDNTNGADGAITGEVMRKGMFTYNSGHDLTGHEGEIVYVVDDQTVNLTGNVTNHILVGAISHVESPTSVTVDFERRA